MELKDVKFTVIITFDITVGQRTGIYSEVSQLLQDSGFKKESNSGRSFPENIYYGVTSRQVEVGEDNNIRVNNLKAASTSINERVVELLSNFFDFKDVDNKIFVHISRYDTSSTLLK